MLTPQTAILDEPLQTELTRIIPTHSPPLSLQCWEAKFENWQSHNLQEQEPSKPPPTLKGGGAGRQTWQQQIFLVSFVWTWPHTMYFIFLFLKPAGKSAASQNKRGLLAQCRRTSAVELELWPRMWKRAIAHKPSQRCASSIRSIRSSQATYCDACDTRKKTAATYTN